MKKINTREAIIKFLKENKAFRDNGNLSSGITNLLRNKHQDIIQKMKEITTIDTDNISQLIWHIMNDIKEIPRCPICGNKCEFKSYGIGYKKTCSSKCNDIYKVKVSQESNLKKYGVKSPLSRKEVREKCEKTNLERHGYTNPFNSKEVQEQIKKTNLEKYGYEVSSKAPEVKEKMRQTNQERRGLDAPLQSKESMDKLKATNMERYGVENTLSSPILRKKGRETSLEKYGTEWPQQSPKVIAKASLNKMKNFYERLFTTKRLDLSSTPLFSWEDYDGSKNLYNFKCNHCGQIFQDTLRNGNIPLCPTCYPRVGATSKEETYLYKFVTDIYRRPIMKNTKLILHGQELDIYLPEKKLAIEYDGLYWHSDDKRDKDYHLNKTIACEKQGIRLIHIFSDEWSKNKDICKSIIKSAIGIYEKKIYARKCEIKEINSDLARDFLNENHLQGNVGSKIRIGLFYEDELISVLTFNEPRYNKNYRWEITRFAGKLNYLIVGGFSKMLKYFRDHYEGSIITYSDRSKFTGDVYRNNGFKELEPTNPNYYYTKSSYERESRLNFQKAKLIKKYPELKDFTENEITQILGYRRFYDCGNWKFELK